MVRKDASDYERVLPERKRVDYSMGTWVGAMGLWISSRLYTQREWGHPKEGYHTQGRMLGRSYGAGVGGPVVKAFVCWLAGSCWFVDLRLGFGREFPTLPACEKIEECVIGCTRSPGSSTDFLWSGVLLFILLRAILW